MFLIVHSKKISPILLKLIIQIKTDLSATADGDARNAGSSSSGKLNSPNQKGDRVERCRERTNTRHLKTHTDNQFECRACVCLITRREKIYMDITLVMLAVQVAHSPMPISISISNNGIIWRNVLCVIDSVS